LQLEPVSPAEMLVDEFLAPLGMSNYRLAKEIRVPVKRVGEIVAGRRAINADMDLRLCKFFGLSEGWWLRPAGWSRHAEGQGGFSRRA
jgi:antitoxin HigA-1